MTKLYTTEIIAIDPLTGELTKYAGQYVPGISFKDAENYCQQNGLGYCKVIGVLISEVDMQGKETRFNIQYN